MKRLTKTLLGTAIAALLVSPLAMAKGEAAVLRAPEAAPKGAAAELDAPTNRLVVKFHPIIHAAGRQDALTRVAASNGISAKIGRELAVGANVVMLDRELDRVSVDALLSQLRADPTVEYAIVDRLMKPLETVSPKYSPTDPDYVAYQWHYYDPVSGINMPNAWNLTRGFGVVVAVLDTGITDHPDLLANTLSGGYDFISTSAVGGDGGGRDNDPHDPGDFTAENECGAGSGPSESSWHGTHVAGTVAAATNNVGVVGVAPRANILPVRVLGKCGGYTSDIADAIIWSSGGTVPLVTANAYPAEVINMSLGGGGSCDPLTQSAIDIAVANGTVVVVAAGNSNESVEDFSPASCNNVISVASHDQTGSVSDFSNVGSLIDVSAPGGAPYIWSTVNESATTPGNHIYGGMQGTSMASPHVAGIVALMQSLDVNTPAQVESLLELTSKPMGAGCPGLCGAGRVNAFAALNAVNGTLPVPRPTDTRNGVSQAVPAGASGSQQFFTLTTLAPVSNLSFKLSGGSGNADLYVRYGAKPTTSTYDCRSNTAASNTETCNIASPVAGKYYVMVRGAAAHTGVSLLGKYNTTTFFNPNDVTIREEHAAPAVANILVHGRSGNASASTPVRVVIRHDYVSDTNADLVAPDGTVYPLWSASGNFSADNTFMVDLSSEAKNGVWKVRVWDGVNKDVGHLDYASIKM